MKNKIKMDLALLMFATVIPNTAFAQDSSNQVPSEQVEFADIYIGDELITVPVVIESEIACKTARSGVQYEDTIPSLTVEKQKNGCKASKINACSRFLFRNDMCYCAIFFTLW